MSLRTWAIPGASLLAAAAGAFGLALVVHAVPTVSVSVSLSQSHARAGGTADVVATATVISGGRPAIGQRVDFGSRGDTTSMFTTPAITRTDRLGHAAAHLRPGTALVPLRISALSGGAGGTASLTQYGAAAGITVRLGAPTLVADGSSTVQATVTVTDSAADGVPAETVFLATGGDLRLGAVTDNADGTYSATLSASTTAGAETVTATDGEVADDATFVVEGIVVGGGTPGPIPSPGGGGGGGGDGAGPTEGSGGGPGGERPRDGVSRIAEALPADTSAAERRPEAAPEQVAEKGRIAAPAAVPAAVSVAVPTAVASAIPAAVPARVAAAVPVVNE